MTTSKRDRKTISRRDQRRGSDVRRTVSSAAGVPRGFAGYGEPSLQAASLCLSCCQRESTSYLHVATSQFEDSRSPLDRPGCNWTGVLEQE